MKHLRTITLSNLQGEPYVDEDSRRVLNTLSLLQILLDHSTYSTRGDQRRADRLYAKLETLADRPILPDFVNLEDVDFEMVERLASVYTPFLQGRLFTCFLDELDRAKDQEPT